MATVAKQPAPEWEEMTVRVRAGTKDRLTHEAAKAGIDPQRVGGEAVEQMLDEPDIVFVNVDDIDLSTLDPEECAAILEGLADIEAGRTYTTEEVLAHLDNVIAAARA